MNLLREKVQLPFWLEAVALLIIPFEELLALSYGSVLRIVNFMALISAALYMIVQQKHPVIRKRTLGLVIFYLWMVLSWVWCHHDGLYFDRLSTYTLGLVLIIMLQSLAPNQRSRELLVAALWLGGVLAAFVILFGRTLTIAIGERETISLFGRKVDPNYLGISLVVSASINVCYLFSAKTGIAAKLVLGGAQLALASAVVALGSRGAFLSMTVVLLVFVLTARFKRYAIIKKLLFMCFALLVGILFYRSVLRNTGDLSRFTIDNLIGKGVYGSANRTTIWSYAIAQFKTRPILGFGMGSSPYVIQEVYKFYGIHNSYLMILLEYGVIGFGFFCAWMLPWLFSLYCRENKVFFFMELAILCAIMFVEGFPTKVFWGTHIAVLVATCRLPYTPVKDDDNNV